MRIVTIGAACLILTSCASWQQFKDWTNSDPLHTQDGRKNTPGNGGNHFVETKPVRHTLKYEPVGAKSLSFEDTSLRVQFIPKLDQASVSFVLENKTHSMVRILWDESVLVDSLGVSRPVASADSKAIQADEIHRPTMIAPESMVSAGAVATSQVKWEENRWVTYPFCGETDSYKGVYKAPNCTGQTFSLILTVDIDGRKKSVPVKFKVTDTFGDETAKSASN
jgi:hypothetical protein